MLSTREIQKQLLQGCQKRGVKATFLEDKQQLIVTLPDATITHQVTKPNISEPETYQVTVDHLTNRSLLELMKEIESHPGCPFTASQSGVDKALQIVEAAKLTGNENNVILHEEDVKALLSLPEDDRRKISYNAITTMSVEELTELHKSGSRNFGEPIPDSVTKKVRPM